MMEDPAFFESWMREALKEARAAAEDEEVPVGAVVILNNRVIGRGHNQVEGLRDATAHAEMIALTAASEAAKDWRLEDATLVVTLEPCVMCYGAALQTRVGRIIYGAPEPKFGACGSRVALHEEKKLIRRPVIVPGVMAEEAAALIVGFFGKIRMKDKA
ncbi:MAG: nucleoside deaminase [Planctomycetota bacterium]